MIVVRQMPRPVVNVVAVAPVAPPARNCVIVISGTVRTNECF